MLGVHRHLRLAKVGTLILLSLFPSLLQAKKYSIAELVTQTQFADLKIRENAENLFQKHQSIKVAIGRIIPSLNLNLILNIFSESYLDVATSALSFLLPANWFRWKESKLIYEAERYSYVSLIANEINTIISASYRIHYIKSLFQMYTDYLAELYKVVLRQEAIYETGESNLQSLLSLKNFLIKIKTDRDTLELDLAQLKISLANGLGLPQEEWPSFDLEDLVLPNLADQKELDLSTFTSERLERSPEIINLDYLILASKFAMKTRIFEFMTPVASADSALGTGFPSYVRVQKSMTRQLKIRRKDTLRTLESGLKETALSFNTMIKLYKLNSLALANEHQIQYAIHAKIMNDQTFKIEEIIANFEDLFRFRSRMLDAQHKFLIAQEQIRRFLLNPPHYDRLIELAPSKRRERRALIHKLEDYRINKALAAGKIKIPKP